jgi:hypothetical protein
VVKKINIGHCALCGAFGKLTFEHVPPQCAFNTNLMFVQRHEHLSEQQSRLFGKYAKSPRGFGKHSLCEPCNNNTGNWYAKDFCDFTEQGLPQVEAMTTPLLKGDFAVKPLNVLKQILMMFISADSSGVLRKKAGLVDYLMQKENTRYPLDIGLYLYANRSARKRLIGYSAVLDAGESQVKHWSEINFQPFGYFLTYKSPPPNRFMTDITGMKNYAYDQASKIGIPAVYLAVSSPLIGFYDNLNDNNT